MTTFTLLFIDTNEEIGRSRQIESPTDEQAVDIAAREPGDYRAVQIWNGDRCIALLGNPRAAHTRHPHHSRPQGPAPELRATARLR